MNYIKELKAFMQCHNICFQGYIPFDQEIYLRVLYFLRRHKIEPQKVIKSSVTSAEVPQNHLDCLYRHIWKSNTTDSLRELLFVTAIEITEITNHSFCECQC